MWWMMDVVGDGYGGWWMWWVVDDGCGGWWLWWVLVAVDDGCGGCCRVQRLSAEMLRPFVKFVLLEPTPSHPQAPLLRLQLQQLLLHVCRHSAAGDTWLSLLLDALPCYQVGGGVGVGGGGGGCKGRVGGSPVSVSLSLSVKLESDVVYWSV